MLRLAAMAAVVALVALPQDPTAEVKQSAADWAAAFNKADAKAIGAMYTADAVLIEGDGTRFTGRAAIEKHEADGFAGAFKGAKITVNVGTVRFLKPDVAVSDGTYSVAMPGQPTANGLFMVTSVKQGGKWLLSGDVGVVPPPPAPPAKAPPKKP